MTKLKAGVIGAGVFGGYHAHKYSDDPRVELISIYDVDQARAAMLAKQHRACAAPSLEAFLSSVDIVTIASSPTAHAGGARAALDAGKHALVEKPLAVDIAAASYLVRTAQEKNLVLACGHQERLVFEAMGLFSAPERPTKIECVRAGPWTGRSADVSVTLDLMVHDLDLALELMGEAPKRVSARGRAKHGSPPDEMTALLAFSNGGAKLSATRIAEARSRTMRLIYPSGEVMIDFIARTFENKTRFALNQAFAETPEGRDPLGANVAHFIDAVTGARARPAVTGAEGEAVLALALRVDCAADFPSLAAAESDNVSALH